MWSDISILSPRAGRDGPLPRGTGARYYFNPLAPCGARLMMGGGMGGWGVFQSTRPVRGETDLRHTRKHLVGDFNPLAPRGARLACPVCGYPRLKFQPTRPVRGETGNPAGAGQDQHISIHSPRAGRDTSPVSVRGASARFQSTRPVRGETCYNIPPQSGQYLFQSTRPVRGETQAQILLWQV